jgi:hypothetical protein
VKKIIEHFYNSLFWEGGWVIHLEFDLLHFDLIVDGVVAVVVVVVVVGCSLI